MTRITVKVNQYRYEGTYACQVFVEGRVNIASGSYFYDTKGNGTSNVDITGEQILMTALLFYNSPHSLPPPLSCRHPH